MLGPLRGTSGRAAFNHVREQGVGFRHMWALACMRHNMTPDIE